MAKVQAVVVLFSPDDEAKLRAEFITRSDGPGEKKLRGQPRPNVLFEAGLHWEGTRTRRYWSKWASCESSVTLRVGTLSDFPTNTPNGTTSPIGLRISVAM